MSEGFPADTGSRLSPETPAGREIWGKSQVTSKQEAERIVAEGMEERNSVDRYRGM